ncbi:MAG: J domain-containing protein [Atopobiaceae bacterium]|nr:J domain-containing protein [Atopobiaceae bacterium]
MPRDDMTREAAEEILELPRRYTKEELRRSYTEIARRYHPDAAAKGHMDPAAAQQRMVQANKAYQLLKRQFKDMPDRVVSRGYGGITAGFSGVDWRAGTGDPFDPSEDPWDFAQDWDAAPPPEKVPLSVRSVLLGPVVLRLVFIGLFGWLWWNNFPLLFHNMWRFFPAGDWSIMDVANLVAAFVYPSYLLIYEIVSGYLSGFVREVLNGIVSWITKKYVDLRPKSSSYGCALYKIVHEQVYALLMAPLVLYLAAFCINEDFLPLKVVYGLLGAALGVDTLAAVAHGGFINVLATALAERIEAWYLLLRARLLKRCGKWEG